MTRAGTALRALSVTLYASSIICFAANQHSAFNLLLIGASLATFASVSTDPRARWLGRERKLRRDRFFDARRDGLSGPAAWVESETAPLQISQEL